MSVYITKNLTITVYFENILTLISTIQPGELLKLEKACNSSFPEIISEMVFLKSGCHLRS